MQSKVRAESRGYAATAACFALAACCATEANGPALWHTILAANQANEAALSAVVFCEHVRRIETPAANHYQDLLANEQNRLLSEVAELRAAGRDGEADRAEADIPQELAQLEQIIEVGAINCNQEFARDRLTDLSHDRMRDDVHDLRNLGRIIADHQLNANQARNLRRDRVEMWRLDGKTELFAPDLAVRMSTPTRGELELARLTRGLLPRMLSLGEVETCAPRQNGNNLVDLEGTLGTLRFFAVLRADLNYRVVEFRLITDTGVTFQHHQLDAYVFSDGRVYPGRAEYIVADEAGCTRLRVRLTVEGLAEASQPLDAHWQIPSGFYVQNDFVAGNTPQ